MQPEFTAAALAEMMAAADTPYLSPIDVHVSPLTTVYEVEQLAVVVEVYFLNGVFLEEVGVKIAVMDEAFFPFVSINNP